MIILLMAWLTAGLAFWINHVTENGFQLGMIDVILGLPMCLILGPIFIVFDYIA